MSTIRGQDGAVKLGGTVIGEIKSFELVIQVDAIDKTAKGSSWRSKTPGLKSWSGRATCNYDPANVVQAAAWTNIEDASNTQLTPAMIFYPGGVSSTEGAYNGSVVITGQTITSPAESEMVSLELTFEGAGALNDGAS